MQSPARMLNWMVLVVAAVGALVALLFAPLRAAFEANMVFNGLIVAVLAIGVATEFVQVAALGPATRWIQEASRNSWPAETPRLLAPMARIVGGREREGFRMSTLAMRSLLDGVRLGLDEARDISRYFIGLLIFLGLLGTFWGLLDTIGGVGKVIGGLAPGGGDLAAVFDALKRDLQGPLAGMGTAFSSSLFGLAGALVLGVLDLQAGHAQNRFYGQLEEWLSELAHLPSGALGLEGEAPIPAYIEALLQQTADALAQLQRMVSRSEDERRATQQGLATLTDRLAELSDQLRSEQKLIVSLSRNQTELQPALAELAQQVAGTLGAHEEMRDHLRRVDTTLGRLLAEVESARGELPQALRQEIRVLAQSLGQRPPPAD